MPLTRNGEASGKLKLKSASYDLESECFPVTSISSMKKPKRLDPHSDEFLRLLMSRQLVLSITCASAFLVALLGLPLLNYYFPDVMATRVAGFTLTWLILGVLFFPLVWVIAWVFIKQSIALEEAEVRAVKDAESKFAAEPQTPMSERK
jgi:uncharacterized membrane protein (DUF485 family)